MVALAVERRPKRCPSTASLQPGRVRGGQETLEKLNAVQRKIDSLDALHSVMQSDSSDAGHKSDAGEVTDPLQRIRMDLCVQREALMMQPSRYFRRFTALQVRP